MKLSWNFHDRSEVALAAPCNGAWDEVCHARFTICSEAINSVQESHSYVPDWSWVFNCKTYAVLLQMIGYNISLSSSYKRFTESFKMFVSFHLEHVQQMFSPLIACFLEKPHITSLQSCYKHNKTKKSIDCLKLAKISKIVQTHQDGMLHHIPAILP